MLSRLRLLVPASQSLAAASAPRSSLSGRAIEDCRHRRTSRSFGVEGDASSRGFAINLGVWVSSLSPRERAQAGHFCPAYASRYPCSFMNYKQGSGGWASKFLFPEGSGAGISTPSASADPLLAGAGTAASAVVGCSRERARAASSALADIVAGSRCHPRDVFAAARPLLLARKEERCVGARSRSTSVHSNNSLCSEFGRLVNPPS